jgi:hypothetical protein
MDEANPAREPGPVQRLYGNGLLVTALLSLIVAPYGLLIYNNSESCFDHFLDSEAARCSTTAAVSSATSFAALLIPIAFGFWGRRGRSRGDVAFALLICLSGYVVPLITSVPVWSSP